MKEAFLVTSEQVKKYSLEKSHFRPVLTGGIHVKRYFIQYPDLFLIYTIKNDNFSKVPNICSYIERFKRDITCKEVKEGKHPLYALHRPRDPDIFTKPEKILGVITEDELVVAIDNTKIFATDGLYIISPRDIDIRFLAGLLNSKLYVYLYRTLVHETGRGHAQVKPTFISEEIPICVIDDNQTSIRDQIIAYVSKLEDVYK